MDVAIALGTLGVWAIGIWVFPRCCGSISPCCESQLATAEESYIIDETVAVYSSSTTNYDFDIENAPEVGAKTITTNDSFSEVVTPESVPVAKLMSVNMIMDPLQRRKQQENMENIHENYDSRQLQ